MKKIQITGDKLSQRLSLCPTYRPGTMKESFSIKVSFMEEGAIQEAILTLYSNETIFNNDNRSIRSFSGIMMVKNKEPRYFSGIFDQYYQSKNEEYEDCYLLVVDPEIFESNIGKQEFIRLAKKYCDSRNIPTYENGNVMTGGFPLFESLPTDKNAPPPTLKGKNIKDMEIWTIMHEDYFPMMYKRNGEGRSKTYFGKFITENKIKVFSCEEMQLLGLEHLVA